MFPRKLVNANEFSLNDKYNVGREYVISDSGYGKDHVKILHVRREGNVHHIKEFEVNTHLKLFSKKDYLDGKWEFYSRISSKEIAYIIHWPQFHFVRKYISHVAHVEPNDICSGGQLYFPLLLPLKWWRLQCSLEKSQYLLRKAQLGIGVGQ